MKLYFDMLKKAFIILIVIFSAISCTPNKKVAEEKDTREASIRALKHYVVYLNDSIVGLNENIKQLDNEIDFWKTSFEDAQINSQENLAYKDSFEYLKEDLFVYQYKLERIKAYNAIVERDNSQNVFFRGWIKRVLED